MSLKKGYELKDGNAKKKDAPVEQPVFKTEETLKQEARERLAEEERRSASLPPRSERRVKYDNYMYHYKTQTIVAIVGVILLAFFLRDTFFRTQPDLTLIIASARYVPQYECDALKDALEKYIGDVNGDGKVLVNLDVINLPTVGMAYGGYGGAPAVGVNVGETPAANGTSAGGAEAENGMAAGGAEAENGAPPDGTAQDAADIGYSAMSSGIDPEMEQASSMKLMAIISAWSDPLYLLDDSLYYYLLAMSGPAPEDDAIDANVSGGESGGGDGGAFLPQQENWMFEPLSGIPAAFGEFGDRLSISDTVLISTPGCEDMGGFSFSLRPAPNAKQKSIDYQAACMRLLEDIAQ